MSTYRPFLLIFLLSSALGSCAVVKKVNDYSNSSLQSIRDYEKLDCSFTEAYISRLRQQEFGNYFAVTTLELDSTRPLRGDRTTLAQARKIDSSMAVIYRVLAGYFDGLAHLSADSVTNYTIDTLTDNLAGGGLIDTMAVSPATITAYGIIVRDITVAVVSEYRAKHLEAYIIRADTPIQILLDKFKTNLQVSLRNLLESQRQVYRDDIYPDMLSKAAPGFGKKQVIDEYEHQLAIIREKERLIDIYARSLEAIAAGHAYLVAHVHELKAKDVKAQLSKYSSTIKELYTSFMTIKKP